MISDTTIQNSITTILSNYPDACAELVERGVKQTAALWNESDGTESDFNNFVIHSYAGTCHEKQKLYERLAYIIEQCSQSADQLNNLMQEPTTLIDKGDPTTVDWIIS